MHYNVNLSKIKAAGKLFLSAKESLCEFSKVKVLCQNKTIAGVLGSHLFVVSTQISSIAKYYTCGKSIAVLL